MKRLLMPLFFPAFFLLSACKEDAPLPLPVALTADSTGYFCQMDLLGHPGPKGQIHLATYPGAPLFFSQVRDVVAYLRMPEQIDTITAVYVSDMGAALSWEEPGATNWIAADQAVYVVGSTVKGGMDAPEFVPFSDPDKAQAFAMQNGGQVMSLTEIPAAAVAVSVPNDGGEDDYAARLHALSDNGG